MGSLRTPPCGVKQSSFFSCFVFCLRDNKANLAGLELRIMGFLGDSKMNLMHKLFFRKFNDHEYSQLVEIHKKETKALRKRPKFIVGIVLWTGLMFYFLFKTFAPHQWNIPKTRDIVGIIIGIIMGLAVSTIVIWLIGKYIFKTSSYLKCFIPFFIPFFMLSMFLTFLTGKGFNIEYLIYILVGISAFGCIIDSIREYFCERLLQEQKKNQP